MRHREFHMGAQATSAQIESKIINGQHAKRSQTCHYLSQVRDKAEQTHQSQHQRKGKSISHSLPGCAIAYDDVHLIPNLVLLAEAFGHDNLLGAVLTRADALSMTTRTSRILNETDCHLRSFGLDHDSFMCDIFAHGYKIFFSTAHTCACL